MMAGFFAAWASPNSYITFGFGPDASVEMSATISLASQMDRVMASMMMVMPSSPASPRRGSSPAFLTAGAMASFHWFLNFGEKGIRTKQMSLSLLTAAYLLRGWGLSVRIFRVVRNVAGPGRAEVRLWLRVLRESGPGPRRGRCVHHGNPAT